MKTFFALAILATFCCAAIAQEQPQAVDPQWFGFPYPRPMIGFPHPFMPRPSFPFPRPGALPPMPSFPSFHFPRPGALPPLPSNFGDQNKCFEAFHSVFTSCIGGLESSDCCAAMQGIAGACLANPFITNIVQHACSSAPSPPSS